LSILPFAPLFHFRCFSPSTFCFCIFLPSRVVQNISFAVVPRNPQRTLWRNMSLVSVTPFSVPRAREQKYLFSSDIVSCDQVLVLAGGIQDSPGGNLRWGLSDHNLDLVVNLARGESLSRGKDKAYLFSLPIVYLYFRAAEIPKFLSLILLGVNSAVHFKHMASTHPKLSSADSPFLFQAPLLIEVNNNNLTHLTHHILHLNQLQVQYIRSNFSTSLPIGSGHTIPSVINSASYWC
jgi:hypothetical protein